MNTIITEKNYYEKNITKKSRFFEKIIMICARARVCACVCVCVCVCVCILKKYIIYYLRY